MSTNMLRPRPALKSVHERSYSLGEDIANAVSHGAGAVLSLVALVVLVLAALETGSGLTVAAYSAFGLSLVLLYTMSTLYHSLTRTRARRVLEILDHSSIYVLIAGSYTAFCLTSLRGPLGWTIFAASWTLAIIGILGKTLWFDSFPRLSVLGYLAMGWLIVFAFKPLSLALPRTSLALLVAGGVSYSAGTIFYALKRVPWFHAVWHLFVLAGSTCHVFSAIFALTLPT
jgi:hemolysin III